MIKRERFGTMPDGSPVEALTLTGSASVSVRLITLGAAITNLRMPDRSGRLLDVVCGYDCAEDYLTAGGYHGAVVGRVCNRIAGAAFTLDGQPVLLQKNDGENCLHSGYPGFAYRNWTVEVTEDGEEPAVSFHLISPDGEGGFPGTLQVTAAYRLSAAGTLSLRLTAVTDRTTVVNLTNHSYFNLEGYDSALVLEHRLWLDADRINEIDGGLIPTGKCLPVEGTPFDFRMPRLLGEEIRKKAPALQALGGYDHNFFLRPEKGIRLAAVLEAPASGCRLRLLTDQPCVQVYTANMIQEDDHPYKGGVRQRIHGAVCLEAQEMPDAVHHPNLASVRLQPGEVYERHIIFSLEQMPVVS